MTLSRNLSLINRWHPAHTALRFTSAMHGNPLIGKYFWFSEKDKTEEMKIGKFCCLRNQVAELDEGWQINQTFPLL